MKQYMIYCHFILLLFSCNNNDTLKPVDFSSLQVNLGSNDVLLTSTGVNIADNYSYAQISLTLISETVIKQRNLIDSVTFTTQHGQFANGLSSFSTIFDLNNNAISYLKYNEPENVIVRASIPNLYVGDVMISFGPSLAKYVFIESDSSSLQSSKLSSTKVNIRLTKLNGIVSEGQQVTLYDSTSNPTTSTVGIFTNTSFSDSLGNIVSRYNLINSTFSGLIFIKFKYQATSPIIIGETPIRIY
jgi:hypothetical protein